MGPVSVIAILIISYAQMAREMDEMLRQQVAGRANSCTRTHTNDDGTTTTATSFLEEVIAPLYEVVAAVCLNFKSTLSSQ